MTMDIDAFKSVNALVIGDLMIDEYLWGSVDRISPEAPVPVVSVEKQSHTLGGAGNVINNLVSMCAAVCAIGTAGTGKAGRMILEKLEELGIDTTTVVSEPHRPTTRKTRVIASSQQVLRIDREMKREITDQTLEKLVSHIADKIKNAHLVIISDYDKGLVTRQLMARTVAIAREHNVLVLADPKSIDFSKYANVAVMTPNKREASLAAGMDIKTGADLEAAARIIMAKAGLEKLLITCGKDGMALFDRTDKVVTIESDARQVFDVSGAGDTVISILGLGLASGAGFELSARIANAAAGIVVAKVGTATASVEELKAVLARTQTC